MKAFITKYALTQGIIELDGDVSENYPGMFVPKKGELITRFHGEGKDWHLTKQGAVARAEAMRVEKIRSLNRQIAKLTALKFE